MPELTLYACTDPKLGYGRMGIEIKEAMTDMGVILHDNNGVPPPPTQTVMWCSMAAHAQWWYMSQYRVLLTMFETTQVPMAMRENIDKMDLVIVPSVQNLEMYSEFHPNVKFVPLGINPKNWHYIERTPPTDKFFFLVQGRGLRKGVDMAYDAFNKAFPEGSWGDGPMPGLIIKSPKIEDAKVVPEHRLGIVAGYSTLEQEIDIYRQAHCFLSPSRGEGFGLQPLQAMAQGLPTILTGAHGHASFAHLGIGLRSHLASADEANFVYGTDIGEWWEPSFSHLVDSMRWVYCNYAEACQRAKESAAVIAEQWTWKQTCEGILDAIGHDRLVPIEASFHIPYYPPRTLVKVAFNTDHIADMGGYRTDFKKGVIYTMTPDQAAAYESQGLIDEGGVIHLQQPLLTIPVTDQYAPG